MSCSSIKSSLPAISVIVAIAGVSFKTRHDCRHTHATWLSDNGASTQELMTALGWKSSKVALG